jgi:hypothetical protein
MSWIEAVGGFIAGFVVGIGATLLYIRWKMMQQIGDIQNQMDAMMDLGDEMEDMMSGGAGMMPEDLDAEMNKEEKEEESEK